MSPGVALAAVARWEDAGIAGRDDTLEAVLPHLKIPGVDHVATLVAMNPLLQSDSLLEKSAELVASQGNQASSPQVEDLCRDALILNDGRRPTSIAKNLEKVPETGVWLKALRVNRSFSGRAVKRFGLRQPKRKILRTRTASFQYRRNATFFLTRFWMLFAPQSLRTGIFRLQTC
jgi:hypothetical protein